MLPVDEQDWHMVYFRLIFEEEKWATTGLVQVQRASIVELFRLSPSECNS
jgi:hypothetical protein